VRDIINGVCHQRYEKGLQHQKGRPDVNICAAHEHLEVELYYQYSITPVYRIFGDFKFVTGLGVLRGAESSNRIHFCPSGQD